MQKNKCKICRREKEKLLLKGDRCMSPKCAMIKRPYPPGQHGQNFRGKMTEYGRQLREKQKMKAIYGLMESKIARYYHESDKEEGNTILNFIKKAEQRVDNVIYMSGLIKSRSLSKQIVSHKLVSVNNKKISIPSLELKEKDVVEIDEKVKTSKPSSKIPAWMDVDVKLRQIKIVREPVKEDIDNLINENLVAEFYSR
jgi:small subunit ribosomal protein S4